MDEIAAHTLPPGTSYEWTTMAYQQNLVGSQILYVFAMAILIVEVAREQRIVDGKPIAEAAVEAAKARLRPILMISFAFILGVVPLVTATSAGANARISLGVSVFSGVIASTCLAVLFVPFFFAILAAPRGGAEVRQATSGTRASPI